MPDVNAASSFPRAGPTKSGSNNVLPSLSIRKTLIANAATGIFPNNLVPERRSIVADLRLATEIPQLLSDFAT
jgi:hypothetical protein